MSQVAWKIQTLRSQSLEDHQGEKTLPSETPKQVFFPLFCLVVLITKDISNSQMLAFNYADEPSLNPLQFFGVLIIVCHTDTFEYGFTPKAARGKNNSLGPHSA